MGIGFAIPINEVKAEQGESVSPGGQSVADAHLRHPSRPSDQRRTSKRPRGPSMPSTRTEGQSDQATQDGRRSPSRTARALCRLPGGHPRGRSCQHPRPLPRRQLRQPPPQRPRLSLRPRRLLCPHRRLHQLHTQRTFCQAVGGAGAGVDQAGQRLQPVTVRRNAPTIPQLSAEDGNRVLLDLVPNRGF